MKKIFCLSFIFACACVPVLKADSPVTSTVFYSAYMEHEIVGYAEQSGVLDDKIAAYLLDEGNLIDVKAAVINALGWDYYGTNNSATFMDHVAKAHGTTAAKLNYASLSGSELMCMGYLKIMDNYNSTDTALQILELARQKMSRSFTVNMIWAIADAQQKFDADWCGVWTNTAQVLNNTALVRDMKTSAIQSVVDYMILYKGSCSYIYSGE